ncbi:ISNCY family transposase [Salicibibacter halophilus]|uniref:ISNCY family transposase n=1 Tax=Salicibibacter halophilus TaxID=2502791 RepID=A0A514LI82_9BACI|nr:ISNCY family transposase [Salicibibacter halophilus]QDI91547.1 ISNCY family transposase [Salicibibacter halophilus]
MNREELKRYTVVQQVMDHQLTAKEAAQTLGLSHRQIFRLKDKVAREGETGVIHKNRERKPAHAIPEHIRDQVIGLLASDRYRNCNDVHFAELLAKHEAIHISPATVRRIRVGAQIKPKRKRRPSNVHRPRERRSQAGQLVQMDASPHHWLEDRSGRISLHAAIDDATGKVVGAVFRPEEDLKGYFMITQQMLELEGIPMSLYSDRHMIFQSPREKQTIEEELAGEPVPLSQFGQALDDLGVTHVKAMTPQAKGRVERLFQTLQDRWVVELRLRGIQTIEEANQVLPALIDEHNRQFAQEPLEDDSAFIPLQDGQYPEQILCYRAQRVLGAGETIAYKGKTYKIQTVEQQSIIPLKTRVSVRETLGGQMFVWYNGVSYPLQETARPKPKPKEKTGHAKGPRTPARDHPWRQYNISRVPQRT